MLKRLMVVVALLSGLAWGSAAYAQYSPTSPRTSYGGYNSSNGTYSTLKSGYYARYYDPTFRPAVGEHWVNGYYQSNSTYVKGHWQTNADNSFWNNYSSSGNVNPHTGRVGTKLPPGWSSGSYRRR